MHESCADLPMSVRCMVRTVAHLVMITGPIAAGKNTVAEHLAPTSASRGHSVVVADVDDVADMVRDPGAGLERFAAHEAHGALVGQWMRSAVDVVISVGPVYSDEEQAAFTRTLPDVAAVRSGWSLTRRWRSRSLGRRRTRIAGFHVTPSSITVRMAAFANCWLPSPPR